VCMPRHNQSTSLGLEIRCSDACIAHSQGQGEILSGRRERSCKSCMAEAQDSKRVPEQTTVNSGASGAVHLSLRGTTHVRAALCAPAFGWAGRGDAPSASLGGGHGGCRGSAQRSSLAVAAALALAFRRRNFARTSSGIRKASTFTRTWAGRLTKVHRDRSLT